MTHNDQEGCKKHIPSVKISDESKIYKMLISQIVCSKSLSKMQQCSFIYYLLLFAKQALAKISVDIKSLTDRLLIHYADYNIMHVTLNKQASIPSILLVQHM